MAGRCEAAGTRSAVGVGQLGQGVGGQYVDGGEEGIGGEGRAGGVGQQGEERQQKRRLVEDAAIVGREIVGIEEEALAQATEARYGRRHFDTSSE